MNYKFNDVQSDITTDRRERSEAKCRLAEGFEAFKLGVMLQELRKKHGMTQEQLAEKYGSSV